METKAEHDERMRKYYERLEAKKEQQSRVAAALHDKGIELSVSACNCCDGVEFSLRIDGVMLVDDEDNYNFDNFAKCDSSV